MSRISGEMGVPRFSCPLCEGEVGVHLSHEAREVACPECGTALWFAAGQPVEPPYLVLRVIQASLDEIDERSMGRRILDEWKTPPRVVIDVSRSTATTSVGIARLLRLHTRMKREGVSLRLCGVQPFLRKTLTMVGLERVFPLDRI